MVSTIPAQFVHECMLFSSCATFRKKRRIIYSNIYFFIYYLLLQYIMELSMQLLRPLLVRRLATPTMRRYAEKWSPEKVVPGKMSFKNCSPSNAC